VPATVLCALSRACTDAVDATPRYCFPSDTTTVADVLLVGTSVAPGR
jgi:hypothetical protein